MRRFGTSVYRILAPAGLLIVPASYMMVPASHAQAVPSGVTAQDGPAVGFRLPSVGGSLNYGITASEILSTGFYQNNGTSAFTNINGNLAYVSKGELHPFSAVYSGGYYIGNTSAPSAFYQSLSFSQVLSTKKWSIVASDSVSYLPQGPTLGLSGVAGVGDLGVPPIQVGSQNGLGILTDYGPRVSNSTSLSVSRRLTNHISLQGSGSLSLLRFIGTNSQYGLNSTSVNGSGGGSYALNARSGLNATYNYTHFTFSGSPFSFDSHSGSFGYYRRLRRDLSFSVYAGPQVALTTAPGLTYNSGVSLSAGASLTYQARPFTYSLSYGRGFTGGSGVIAGGQSDSLNLNASRQFGRSWNTSATASYTRTSSLPLLFTTPFVSNALALGAQVNRALTQNLSAFGSYGLVRQSASGPVTVNTFSGLYQVVGFGLTYSPRALTLNRQ